MTTDFLYHGQEHGVVGGGIVGHCDGNYSIGAVQHDLLSYLNRAAPLHLMSNWILGFARRNRRGVGVFAVLSTPLAHTPFDVHTPANNASPLPSRLPIDPPVTFTNRSGQAATLFFHRRNHSAPATGRRWHWCPQPQRSQEKTPQTKAAQIAARDQKINQN